MTDRGLPATEWGERYSRLRPQHAAFTDELDRLLRKILESANIELAQLESRTKGVDSFCDKIVRKNDKYIDPLSEVTDLSGLRIIVYYVADVARVGELIDKEFSVDWHNSVRRGADTDPDRFGYRSDHYVVRLSPHRLEFAEWRPFAPYKAEIQVRTVMQHAWAAVDHKIRYKSSDLPRDIRRRLYRLSALLEVADDQFADLQQANDHLKASYAEAVARGDLEVSLDVLSLGAFLEETNAGRTWNERAVELGYEAPPPHDTSTSSDDAAFLLRYLADLGLTKLSDVAAFLESVEDWGSTALAAILEYTKRAARDEGRAGYSGRIRASSANVLLLLLLYSRGSPDRIYETRFRPDIKEGLLAAKGALGEKDLGGVPGERHHDSSGAHIAQETRIPYGEHK